MDVLRKRDILGKRRRGGRRELNSRGAESKNNQHCAHEHSLRWSPGNWNGRSSAVCLRGLASGLAAVGASAKLGDEGRVARASVLAGDMKSFAGLFFWGTGAPEILHNYCPDHRFVIARKSLMPSLLMIFPMASSR